MKRFADSAIQEAKNTGAFNVSAALKKAGNLTSENLKNAERDLHVLFRQSGLTVPVELSTLKCGLMHLHYFSLRSWFQFLLTDYSHLLLGGIPLDDPRSKLLTKSFWEMYRVAHSDHWVFMEHNDQLEKCIPYYLHLDEGTSLRKSAILIFNLQSAWGLDTATEFDKVRAGGSNLDAAMMDYMLQAQRHNQRGASLKSRFLYTAIPKRWYTKKYSFVYNKVLDKIATESGKLASEGIKEMFPICLGVKGDAPALAKAGHYNRSFQSLGINLECINFQIFFQSLLPTKLGKSFIFSGQQQSFEELV